MSKKHTPVTVVSDAPPAHRPANAGLEASRQTDGVEDMSTTQRLFGEIMEEANPALEIAPISQHPESNPEEIPNGAPTPTPTPSTPAPQEPPATPETPAPESVPPVTPPSSDDEFIDVDALATKKVRTIIDGKEEVVTLKELRDRAQLKRHLDQAADKVGEERRRLAEERRHLEERRNRSEAAPQFAGGNFPVPADPALAPAPVPADHALASRIQFLEKQLNDVMVGTAPAIWQSTRQRVADDLKREGHPDFLDYIPKMEAEISRLSDPNLAQFYDTPIGAKSLFYQLKNRDLMDAARQPAPRPTVQTPPVAQATNRPPITRIDGGAQPSSVGTDDSQAQYTRSFKRATALGDDREAWNAVLRQKGILPE